MNKHVQTMARNTEEYQRHDTINTLEHDHSSTPWSLINDHSSTPWSLINDHSSTPWSLINVRKVLQNYQSLIQLPHERPIGLTTANETDYLATMLA